MQQDKIDMTMVLDRSGSMQQVRDDTIGGVNSFLAVQKNEPGQAVFTLVQFDSEYEFVHSGIPLADVPELNGKTFVPRGSTSLLDAIGRAINETGSRLAKMPEGLRPARVLFIIVTDGGENSSKEFKHAQILEMINHQRQAYSWEFIFIGANQDAIQTGSAMGIPAAQSLTYAANPQGTRSAFGAASGSASRYRSGASSAFTVEDRKTQKEAGAQS